MLTPFCNPLRLPAPDDELESHPPCGSAGGKSKLTIYQERVDRAEQWLHRVYTESEDRFLRQDDGRRSMQRPTGRRA